MWLGRARSRIGGSAIRGRNTRDRRSCSIRRSSTLWLKPPATWPMNSTIATKRWAIVFSGCTARSRAAACALRARRNVEEAARRSGRTVQTAYKALARLRKLLLDCVTTRLAGNGCGMSLTDPDILELNELCNAVVDGTLSESQKAIAVSMRLSTSEEARQFYVRALGLSASLHSYAGEMQTGEPDTPAFRTKAAGRWKWVIGLLSIAASVALAAMDRSTQAGDDPEPAIAGPRLRAITNLSPADRLEGMRLGDQHCRPSSRRAITQGTADRTGRGICRNHIRFRRSGRLARAGDI